MRFGGSSGAWFGRIAVPDRVEFEQRAWVGTTGWPFCFDEIAPWLARAARFLTVATPDRLDPATWSTDPTARLIASHPDAAVGVFLWATTIDLAQSSTQWLRTAGNIRVLLGATATELAPVSGAPRIGCVRVIDKEGTTLAIEADSFVLAGGGIENPRLLLASNTAWPAGVGNHRGLVGKYFMEHPRMEGAAQLDLTSLTRQEVAKLRLLGERTSTPAGRAQLRVQFSPQFQRSEELLNHSMHGYIAYRGDDSDLVKKLRSVRRNPRTALTVAKGERRAAVLTPRHIATLARLTTDKFIRRVPERLILVDQMEQPPQFDNSLSVDWSQKDEFGLPATVLRWTVSAEVERSQRKMHELAKSLFERAGITTFASRLLTGHDVMPDLLDMKHPMGTTRMASTASSGVVDANCKVYGIDNLFVTGSSVFPISGHANPTLLIAALGLRLGDHLRHSS